MTKAEIKADKAWNRARDKELKAREKAAVKAEAKTLADRDKAANKIQP